MKYNAANFSLKTNKLIPVDEFVNKVLYHPKSGYYAKKIPKKDYKPYISLYDGINAL